MRTDDEIITRINQTRARDIFSFELSDLADYLPALKLPLIGLRPNPEFKTSPRDKESIEATMRDYMSFAWGKANNCRGLSALRSLSHYQAWLWMVDHPVNFANYTHYGKPQLRAICEHYGWDWRSWDSGSWKNDERTDGEPAPETVPSLETYYEEI